MPKPQPRALSEGERSAIVEYCDSERFCDLPPAEIYATLLDEGVYMGSISTFYRVLHSQNQVRERRNQAVHPPRKKPELMATKPNSCWSWDIERHEAPLDRVGVKGSHSEICRNYLDHIDTAATYWHLSAVPDLLALAARRLEVAS